MTTRDPLTNVNAKSIHVFEVFKSLKKRHPTFLLVSDVNDSLYSDENIIKIPHTRTRFLKRIFNAISYQVALYFHLKRITSQIKQVHPDKKIILYVRQSVFFLVPLIFARIHHVPAILEVNGSVELEMKLHRRRNLFLFIWASHWILRLYYTLSWHIVTVTPQLKQFLQRTHSINPKKMTVIENGTNTNKFKPMNKMDARMQLKLPNTWNEKCIIGFIGNMEPWQGLETLIKAAPLVIKQRKNVTFLLVGDGKLRPKLEKLIHQYHLDPHFILTGRIPYPKIPTYIGACDVMVAPFIGQRNREIGLSPLKVYDSLSCGRPIITSKIPNLEFVEERSCGFLVEPECPKDLASKLLEFFDLPREIRTEMGKNGRTFIKKNHDWDEIARKISILVNKMIEN